VRARLPSPIAPLRTRGTSLTCRNIFPLFLESFIEVSIAFERFEVTLHVDQQDPAFDATALHLVERNIELLGQSESRVGDFGLDEIR
jgi:hypothetical protein